MGSIEELERVATVAQSASEAAVSDALSSADWLGEAIDADRAAGRFARWGRSTVIDENTESPLMPQALFDALHRRAHLEASWPVGNAGLLHTYGYLLSLVPTPFGLKRERWLGAGLSTALGLDAGHFIPWLGPDTLLARATEAAAVLLDSGGEFSWYSLASGRATRAVLGDERGGMRALAYAVAAAPGGAPLLVTMFPVEQSESIRRDLDEASARLRWNAA